MGAFSGIRPIIGALATLAVAVVFAAPAQAATYVVGTTNDATGSCTPSTGTCSLRQLIAYENGLPTSSPVDMIVVPAGSYDLTAEAITITRSVSISGAGASATDVFQGSETPDRVFAIEVPQTGVVPTVSISGLSIRDGTSDAGNGYYGGDILNQGTLTLSEDVIANGLASAGSGGGISNDGGTLTVTQSLVSNNTSTCCGGDSGGIQNYGPNPVTGTAGKLSVENSTIADNTAALGGGIFSWCAGTNNACSSNSNGATNTTTITNSTVAFNNGGSRSATGGGLLASEGTISVQNSIVADNVVMAAAGASSPSNCGTTAPGVITSLGYNLETATDCEFKSTGDLQNANPEFTSALPQDNGDDTATLSLDAKSPAVDAVPTGAPGCGGTDQRGVSRPQGTGCDIGAFELFQPTEGQSAVIQVADAQATISVEPTINWGDGTPSSAGTVGRTGGPITGTHTYATAGIYTGSVSWQDDAGSHTVTFDVKVVDGALSATAIAVSATAGTPFGGPVATFTDANPGGTLSQYSATINWGDGTSSAGTVMAGTGDFVVSGSHTYVLPGAYQTTVTIRDVGGATATATGTAAAGGPPAPVITGAPVVTGPNGAAFSGTVNPDGLATTAYFQYGIPTSAQGPEGPGPTFTEFTPVQTVGSDFSNHAISASASGLVPNEVYEVQLVATNSAGTSYGPIKTFTTAQDAPPPPPVLGKTVNASPVSGVVFIKPPPGKSLGGAGDSAVLSKGQGFVPLTEARQIPTGSEIDALHGSLKIVTATGKVGKTQNATLAGGVFKLAQTRTGISKGLTNFALQEGAFQGAPTYATCKTKGKGKKAADQATIASLSSKTLQLLKASAHGKFKTTGRYSSATVRGTIWTIADRCDGTLTHAIRDTVLVQDFVRHTKILLHAGHSYLARAIVGHKALAHADGLAHAVIDAAVQLV